MKNTRFWSKFKKLYVHTRFLLVEPKKRSPFLDFRDITSKVLPDSKNAPFWGFKINLKIVVSKLKLWVWKVKLCLFQVKTTSQKRFWTTLESFWALWQHFQYLSQNLIFRHFLGRLEFCVDVNWRLCLKNSPHSCPPTNRGCTNRGWGVAFHF